MKEGKIVGGNIVPRTKTKLAKRATWDPEIPVTNLSSVSTQISSSSPDSDPASGINPGLGPGQVSTNVLHRRRETRSKVTIRWAGKITNRRLAKIEKKKAYDTWDYLREKSLPATTTAPFSAAVKSLPPTSDPVPDADTYQNPGRAPTICPDPAPISTYPFPDSNSNQSQTTRSILKTALKKKTNTLLRYLEDVRNQRRLTLINQSVANIF